jgi:Zn-dependent protease
MFEPPPPTVQSHAVKRTQGQQALGMAVSTLLLFGWLALRGNWMWALGAVVGVFVHEYGHVLAMNALGCGPATFRVVPFLGGAATPRQAPGTEFKDVLISLAGPAFGLLAILPFYALQGITQDMKWLDGALAVVVINLLNLVPAPPLDGSRALGPVLARFHPQVERLVLVVVGAVAVLWLLNRHSWLMALFIGLSVYAALKRPTIRPFALRLSGRELPIALSLYVATFALCVAMFQLTLALAGVDDPLAGLLRLLGTGG